LRTKRRTKKKKDSVRKIADEQGYSKSTRKGQYADLGNDEVDGHLLAGEKIEDLGVVGVLGALEECRRQKSRVGAVE